MSLWSPAFVNISLSSPPLNPWSPLHFPLLLYRKTSKYCFPETLLREAPLSVLFIPVLAPVLLPLYQGRRTAVR